MLRAALFARYILVCVQLSGTAARARSKVALSTIPNLIRQIFPTYDINPSCARCLQIFDAARGSIASNKRLMNYYSRATGGHVAPMASPICSADTRFYRESKCEAKSAGICLVFRERRGDDVHFVFVGWLRVKYVSRLLNVYVKMCLSSPLFDK